MNFNEVVATRRSIRKYREESIPQEVIERLLDATFTAPSSKCCRSTRLMVVEDQPTIEKLSTVRDAGAAFLKSAPLAIIVCGESQLSDIWEINATISATILQLSCANEGLGSCWVNVMGRPAKQSEPEGVKAAEVVRQFIEMPEGWEPLCIIAIGYAAHEPNPLPDFDRTANTLWVKG